MISDDDIRGLSELARIELSETERDRLRGDLERILDHVRELAAVPTENVRPMTGGTFAENVVRSDVPSAADMPADAARASFPESRDRFLKVPGVFE